MGNRPSSYFGFGVALEQGFPEKSEEPGSPWRLYANGEVTDDGVAIVSSGYCDDPCMLVVIGTSMSHSDDWEPERCPVSEAQPGWAAKIEAYLDRWNLRGKVRKSFEVPGFIHAPYYG